MKVVILAGGFGTRLSEETEFIPKPMIEIGGMPIIWHIMKEYSYYGYNEFIVCAGYKQQVIKKFFSDYYLYNTDVSFDMKNNKMTVHNSKSEDWIVTIIDTGLNTMTGGRIKRIKEYVGNKPFLLTYGDGVCDVNINRLVEYHKKNKKTLTLTAIRPSGRFGILTINDKNEITQFNEKSKEFSGWINGGYMVCEPQIFDLIEGDDTVFEKYPLEQLANENDLAAYKHDGFWQCMDTLKEKKYLEELINTNNAPWIRW